MTERREIQYSLSDIDLVVRELQGLMARCAIFTFTGQLGAGKSTVIRALLRSCGVQGVIASPTFTIMNVHENNRGERFYHFDLYRISSLDEFIQAGFNEYLYQPNSWSFIEWPESIEPLLTHGVCHVQMEYVDPTTRKITLNLKI